MVQDLLFLIAQAHVHVLQVTLKDDVDRLPETVLTLRRSKLAVLTSVVGMSVLARENTIASFEMSTP